MNNLSEKNKKSIKVCITIALFVFIVSIIAIVMIRYNTEGEKNLPFQISSIKIISTAEGENTEDKLNLNIVQKNDIYFYIDKNPDYSKEDSITKVSFENFNFEKSSDKGTINIYKPSTNLRLYSYTDEYKVDNELSYVGALTTNLPSLEIGNQGGLIGFSIATKDLGNYVINENADTIHNGTLLSKLNLTSEDISMKVSFDVIIETSSKNKFKTTLNFDLPTGNIVEDGVSVFNKEDFSDIVFKRF